MLKTKLTESGASLKNGHVLEFKECDVKYNIGLKTVAAFEAYFNQAMKHIIAYSIVASRGRKAKGYALYKPTDKKAAGKLTAIVYSEDALTWIGSEKWPDNFLKGLRKSVQIDGYKQAREAVAKLLKRKSANSFFEMGVAYPYAFQGAMQIALYSDLGNVDVTTDKPPKIKTKVTQAMLKLLQSKPRYDYTTPLPRENQNPETTILDLTKQRGQARQQEKREQFISPNKSAVARATAGTGIDPNNFTVSNYSMMSKYSAIPTQVSKGGTSKDSFNAEIMALLKPSKNYGVTEIGGVPLADITRMLTQEMDYITGVRRSVTAEKADYVKTLKEVRKKQKA
jgi:hypothetical protein